MSYRHWRKWVKSLPISLRWFVYLVLLRPLIDIFYETKIPFLPVSPLQFVGVLTPFLILLFALSRQLPGIRTSLLDKLVNLWGLFTFLSVAFYFVFFPPELDSIGLMLKVTMVIYLYAFMRRFIRSRLDLEGILITFLYSAIIPAIYLFYELAFGAIQVATSRGFERIQGGYADVLNYSIYALMSFIVVSYLLRTSSTRSQLSHRRWLMGLITMLTLFVLFHIYHNASNFIFLALASYYLFTKPTRSKVQNLVAVILIFGASVFVARGILEEKAMPLVATDISVIKGEVDTRYAFHGRVSRWERYWGIYEKMSTPSKLLGVGLSGDRNSLNMFSGGMHSDYVRIFFSAGIFGFLVFIGFLLTLYMKSTKFHPAHRYLVRSSLIVVAFYAVSTVPTLYYPLMYIVLAIFAFAALPKSAREISIAQAKNSLARKAAPAIHRPGNRNPNPA